jgi:hypothetical protein
MIKVNQQIEFFRKLGMSLPSHAQLVNLVSETLSISSDRAYRRIRGEKLLEFDEIQKLCLRFNFSFDQFTSVDSHKFLFSGILPTEKGFIFRDWLNGFYKQFEFMNGFPEKHFYWFVRDFPVFIHFQVPELAAFKFFFWSRSILGDESLKEVKFSVRDVNDPNIEFAQQISRLYVSLPTTEIWNIENISATLRQIEYYRHVNAFQSGEDLMILYDKLEQLVDHVEKQAALGKKFMFGEQPTPDSVIYNLYENDLILGDGTSIAEIGKGKVTWIIHGFINIITTLDPRFNEYTFRAMKNLVRKSNQISVFAESERRRFFDAMREKIQRSREGTTIA